MSKEAASSSTNVSFIVGIVFVTLKLTNLIAWSWVWVLSPFWIPFALVFGVFLLVILAMIIGALISGFFRN